MVHPVPARRGLAARIAKPDGVRKRTRSGSRPHWQRDKKASACQFLSLLRCDQCTYSTERSYNLNRHKEKSHSQLREPLKCCNKEFSTLHEFNVHRTLLHLNRGYACTFEECWKTFTKKSLLERRVKAHKGEYQYSCENCKYQTCVLSNFQRHKKAKKCLANQGVGPQSDGKEAEGLAMRPVYKHAEAEEHKSEQEQQDCKHGVKARTHEEYEAAFGLLLLHETLYARESE
ncbi:hypothetical protein HPB50_017510 [Hyalomma asiaticum]|uniref:Uncharacterized protein n=1 Tax=Hyalomma asiaticum TaxID=266040 RepID=A0ACB7SFN3_HYAAI|nr:hypothetical protein HPB50_017510 [Hyalomma asiaticum]